MTETSTYTHAELSARLAEVERERDELAAMVGRLREALSPMADEADFVPPDTDEVRLLYEMDGAQINELSFFNGEDFAHAKALLSETPSTALAEIRAEAVEAAIDRCAWYGDRVWMKIDDLKNYAQQLRNGGE